MAIPSTAGASRRFCGRARLQSFWERTGGFPHGSQRAVSSFTCLARSRAFDCGRIEVHSEAPQGEFATVFSPTGDSHAAASATVRNRRTSAAWQLAESYALETTRKRCPVRSARWRARMTARLTIPKAAEPRRVHLPTTARTGHRVASETDGSTGVSVRQRRASNRERSCVLDRIPACS